MYGHIRCTYTVLANPTYALTHLLMSYTVVVVTHFSSAAFNSVADNSFWWGDFDLILSSNTMSSFIL